MTVSVEGAKAPISVEYYNAGDKAGIHLLWSSASTPRQIIPQRYLYPEAATNESAPTDTNKQTGMLLLPGSDAGPKATRLQLGVLSRWLASQLIRAGLVLLIVGGVLALLLRINWRQARRRFTMVAASVVSRLRDQIAARFGELFWIANAVFDKLQFVAGFGKRLLAGTYDKLNLARLGRRLSKSEISVGTDLRVDLWVWLGSANSRAQHLAASQEKSRAC